MANEQIENPVINSPTTIASARCVPDSEYNLSEVQR